MANYKGIDEDIEILIERELKSAMQHFPPFHSEHEAYAVISEELEETAEALEFAQHRAADYWRTIRGNSTLDLDTVCMNLRKAATDIIKEAVQVAAMCDKALFINDQVPQRSGLYECFNCGAHAVAWRADFDAADYGYEGAGVIHECACTNCGAEITYYVNCEEDEDD